MGSVTFFFFATMLAWVRDHEGTSATDNKLGNLGDPRDTDPQERDAIERAQAGDLQPLGEVLRRYEARIYSLVLRWVRRPDEAREVMQDALVNALVNIGKFDNTRPFRPWLFKVVINACRNHNRKGSRGEMASQDVSQGRLHAENPDGEALWQVNIKGSEGLLLDEQQRQGVARAIAMLSPEEQTLVMMRYNEDLSFAELAQAYGLPVPIMKMRVHRAMKRLKAHCAAEGLS